MTPSCTPQEPGGEPSYSQSQAHGNGACAPAGHFRLALPECWCFDCVHKRYPSLPISAGFDDDTRCDGETTVGHFRNATICRRDPNLGGETMRYYAQ